MSNVAEAFKPDAINLSKGIFKCADRTSPGNTPKDITSIKELYLPFEVTNKVVHLRRNPFGAVIYRRNVNPGSVYHAFDGKRLVVEVGCNTVIYIHIDIAQSNKHHRLFIQSESAFSEDTTIRRDAAIIAKNTQHIETIVKYEMYFILGIMSTTSLAAWLMVTGSDVTYIFARNKVVAEAAKKLAKSLLEEVSEIEEYAPILHKKILELVVSEGKSNSKRAVKELPGIILTDEKVQAQVAGIIFGKWAIPNGNPFNIWTILTVVLTQAAVKSATKYGDAYLQAIDGRYKSIIDDINAMDVNNQSSMQKPANSLVKLMLEAGVTVSVVEANAILSELGNNKVKAHKNLSNITKSINEFRKVASR